MKKYAIVAPCFNESELIERFLKELEMTLSSTDNSFDVIVVDDCSTDNSYRKLQNFKFEDRCMKLSAIKLRYNSGHQEAIRQGLVYAYSKKMNYKGVFVMDCDGEDDPKAIVKMAAREDFDIVFFKRGKRKESLMFRAGYFFYKILFKVITGNSISFGNFSLISNTVLSSIVHQKFVHYAGFLSKQRYRIEKIKFDRRKRIDGKSKMNFNGLAIHGLKALIEYSEELLGFFLKSMIIFSVFSSGIGLVLIYKKFVSHEAILGWASLMGVGLAIVFLVIITFIVSNLMILSIKSILSQGDQGYETIEE